MYVVRCSDNDSVGEVKSCNLIRHSRQFCFLYVREAFIVNILATKTCSPIYLSFRLKRRELDYYEKQHVCGKFNCRCRFAHSFSRNSARAFFKYEFVLNSRKALACQNEI